MAAKTRDQIEEKDKWDLKPMYGSDEEWETDLKRVSSLVPPLIALRGRLAESGAKLAEAFELSFALDRAVTKVYTYSSLRHDEDTADPRGAAMHDKAQMLTTEVSAKTSWFAPELLTIEDSKLEELRRDPAMAKYGRALELVLHDKPHTLSPQEELLMSLSGDALASAQKTYSVLCNADMKFPVVKGTKPGETVELTKGNYILLLQCYDRDVRRGAFEAMYDTHAKLSNTLTATLDGQVRKQIFVAKARKFPSALAASLHNDAVPVDVYDSLIEAIHTSLPRMYEYVALRKKCLKLEKLDMYDFFVPIVEDYHMEVPYETACKWVTEALRPLGAEYVATIEKALSSRWVDVWENRGKRSGAYSSGCFDSVPYVLMNYQPDMHSAFTLAHELGHSMHSWLSNHHQPYEYSSYKIFVAEVASTVNEGLLNAYLMKTMTDKKARAYLLSNKADDFRTTVFRQVMFAEFEKKVHALAEAGEALTPSLLNDVYFEMNKLYYGPDVDSDRRIAYEWMRIPHFYYNFYVYKYATSFAVAEKVVASILAGEPGFVEKYMRFLSSGCVKDPLDILTSTIGIDLTKPYVIQDAMSGFSKIVKELEALLL